MGKLRCLYCYETLQDTIQDYHAHCCRAFFGTEIAPTLEYTNDQMLELAEKIIQSQQAVTGVQPKLSLGLQQLDAKDKPGKLTIMGLWGTFILKPPSEHYADLPELEDVTMHLAEASGIPIVPHSLIRLASGELAYLTRRIDRDDKRKFHMEDMCQVTGRMTEEKYRGSYERVCKAIVLHSATPALDAIRFFELLVFCFLTGNNDMHLKNFSMFRGGDGRYVFSPAYDLVPSELVVEGDDEETALMLNGKKRKLKKKDFQQALLTLNLSEKVLENAFSRMGEAIPKWSSIIKCSFLPEAVQNRYIEMIERKALQIEL